MLRRILLMCSLLWGAVAIAQNPYGDQPDWAALMQDPNVNFFELRDAFNGYWEGREITPGCGYKPFKRWEARMELRVREDGSIPRAGDFYRAHQDLQEFKAARSEAGNWQQLGPILDGLTTRDDIPGVGRLNTVAFHPTDPNIIFVGAPSGGLWRSYDGGQSWESNTDALPTLGVSAIAFDPFIEDVVYIGTGDRDANDAAGMGVMKSVDGGITWEFSNGDGMDGLTVGDIIADPQNPGVILAATSNGVRRSDDHGETWTLESNTMNYKQILFKPGDSQIVYATAIGRLYRSTNNGQSWSIVTDGLVNGTRNVIAVTPANPELVYMCSANTYAFRALYRSTNSGESFEEMSDSPNILDWSASGDGDGGQAWYDLCMEADPVDPDRIYVGGIRMKRSDDGGATWIDIQNSYLHVDQHWCKFSPHDGKLYLANDGGIYVLDSPGQWVDLSNDIVAGQIYKFGQAPFTANDALTGYQDNGSMSYNGVVWDRVGGGDGFECQYDPTDESVFYTSLYYGRVYRTNNDVSTQQFGGEGQLDINESGAWSTPWFVSKWDENTMFLGLKNVWRSRNIKVAEKDSIVWEKISSDLGGNDNSNLISMVQSRADSNIVYCSEGTRRFFRTDNALAPVDEVTWTDHSNDLPWVQVPVSCIETHPIDSATVYIGFNGKVWKSINAGEDWEDISGTMPQTVVNSIAYDIQTDEGLYAATDMGIYYKDATMEDWVFFGSGMPETVSVTELEIYYGETVEENRIRASTYGRGLWESDLYGSETNLFPATAWLLPEGETAEIYGETVINAGFYRNLQNISVNGFDINDVTVSNGTISEITGGPIYNITVTPDEYGVIELSIPDAVATDDNGVETYASSTLKLVYKEAPESFGIYGPGGVGDEADIALWLRADQGTFIESQGDLASLDGDKVQEWVDLSGNGLIALQDTLDDRPTLRLGEAGINGRPAIEFNGENEFLIGRDIPSSVDLSVFSIARGSGTQWNDHGWIASARQPNGFILHPWKESSLFNATVIDENQDYHSTPQQWIVDAAAPQIYGFIYEYHPEYQVFQKVINGARLDYNDDDHAGRVGGQLLNVNYGWDFNERYGEGQIGEHFIYGRRLFETHRLLVVNYLGARYGLDIGPATRYYRPDMPLEVAGIGQLTEFDKHEDAQGMGNVRMLNASDMEDGEFLIWGHNEFEEVWEYTGYPLESAHLDRTWAYEQTGDVGTVEFRYYAGDLVMPGEEIGVVVSPTVNFLPGEQPEFFPLTDMGDYWVANVDFTDSGVFTIGTQPQVSVEDLTMTDINLYPNPVRDQLTLELNSIALDGLALDIFDAVGRKVLHLRPQTNRITLNTAGLTSGVYIVQVTKNGQLKQLRFVKQ